MRAFQRPVIAAMVFVLAGTAAPAIAGRVTPIRDSLPSVEKPAWRGPRYVAGEVLVRFKPGRVRAANAMGARSATHVFDGWQLLQLQPGETTDQAIARLQADPSVAQVSANHVYHSLAIPDDPLLGVQWGVRNTGQTINGDFGSITGTSGDDISASSAWDVTTGSSNVIVGVVDTGVASNHPDLQPNVVSGYNFVGDRTTSDTHDVDGHGSHVSGIIGAVGNDGYGVTGVSQHVHIMPLRALDDTGSGSTASIAQAFAYAATHGAKVVNASLGGPDPDPVLEQAIADHPNTLYVVAAGNSGSNNDATPTYPCNYTEANLICVAASDQNDQMASFSNYGATSVDLAAPGENIASTYIPDAGGYQSTYSLADSPSGPYANNSDSWAQATAAIDPAGKTNCNLNYRLRGRMAANDYMTAETTPVGTSTWGTTVDTFGSGSGATTSGAFSSRSVGVGSDGQPFNLRFHLVSDGSGTNDGVFIDNVAVVCGSNTIFGPYDFETSMSGWTTGGSSSWGRASVIGVWVYMSGTSMATPFVTGTAALLWAKEPNATVGAVRAAILGSVDKKAAFNGTVSGGRLDARAALDALPTVDVTPPTGVGFTGAALKNTYQLSSTMTIGWTATDAGSGVKSYDVRYEGARYNGSFGSWINWRSNVTATSAAFKSSPGYSFCFQVRARDQMLNTSAWSASRCTSFPVNDTQMIASAGWTRAKSSTRYLGTDSYTKTKGATLTLAKADFRRMDLVVTLCNGCGSVAVYFGSTYYGTYSLNASTTQTKHITLVRSFSHMVGPATVTIRVTTSGKPVAIEGLGLFRY